MSRFHNAESQSGFSLVQVLIAAGIGTGLLLALSDGLNKYMGSVRKMDAVTDLTSLKNQIGGSIDCDQTIAASPGCLTGTVQAEIVDDRGRVLVPSTGQRFGRFFVRARCEGTGTSGGISVRAVMLSPMGESSKTAKDYEGSADPQHFMKDPVDVKLPYDWKHPKGAIFAEVKPPGLSARPSVDGRLCRPHFTPVGAAPACPAGTVKTGEISGTNKPICLKTSEVPALADAIATEIEISSKGNCTSGQAMVGMKDNVPVCVTMPTPPPSTGGGDGGGGGGGGSSSSTKWLLDRDCAPSAPDCSLCRQLVNAGTCPANPGGLSCSSPGSRCVTPMGCRRYVCN